MKKSILSGLIGLSIVLSIDSISRVFASLFTDQEILMFSYSGYPGIIWPVFLVGIAGFSSFLGGLFSLSYGKEHRKTSFITFLFLMVVLRYLQIHLLFETDAFYSISALIFSLFTLIFAWKIMSPKKQNESTEDFKKTHHQPEDQSS